MQPSYTVKKKNFQSVKSPVDFVPPPLPGLHGPGHRPDMFRMDSQDFSSWAKPKLKKSKERCMMKCPNTSNLFSRSTSISTQADGAFNASQSGNQLQDWADTAWRREATVDRTRVRSENCQTWLCLCCPESSHNIFLLRQADKQTLSLPLTVSEALPAVDLSPWNQYKQSNDHSEVLIPSWYFIVLTDWLSHTIHNKKTQLASTRFEHHTLMCFFYYIKTLAVKRDVSV